MKSQREPCKGRSRLPQKPMQELRPLTGKPFKTILKNRKKKSFLLLDNPNNLG